MSRHECLASAWNNWQLTKFVFVEFKEIRKEWKARKKAEEADRKAREEEAARNAQNGTSDSQSHDGATQSQSVSSYSTTARLPPIGYSPSSYPQPPVSLGQDYSNNYIAAGNYSATSPYAQSHQQVYGHG